MSSQNKIILKTENLSKSYDLKRYIFKDLTHNFYESNIYGISGPNGSGKSTFLQTVSGLISPTKGTVQLNDGYLETIKGKFGFCSPYLNLYEEFSPLEMAKIYSKLRSSRFDKIRFDSLIESYKLSKSTNNPIKSFSSGMKQRVKLILAFLFDDQLVFLDELGTNLDLEGLETTLELTRARKIKNKLTLIASNDQRELEICDEVIEIK